MNPKEPRVVVAGECKSVLKINDQNNLEMELCLPIDWTFEDAITDGSISKILKEGRKTFKKEPCFIKISRVSLESSRE